MSERLIVHCEDNSFISNLVAETLHRRTLHRVGAVAEDLATTFELLRKISRGELIDPKGELSNSKIVLLLDGELKGHNEGDNHPRAIINEVTASGIIVPIIGLSSDGLAHWGLEVGVHIAADITKTQFGHNSNILAKALDDLPEPELRTA